MLMQTTNEFEVRLILKAVSPLLIKDGRYDQDRRDKWARNDEMKKGMPNMIPISRASDDDLRSAVTAATPQRAVEALPFFVPGSSLRGSWRSHLERVVRGINPPEQAQVCDPFEEEQAQESCSNYATRFRDAMEKQPQDKRQPVVPYRLSCPVCKLFGHTTQAARLKISDGERINPREGSIAAREHVRIDRSSGQVAKGMLFKIFALQGASFETTLHIRNFELWHLQLVSGLLKEIAGGLVPLGSGKNKGYGKVVCAIKEVRLTAFGLEKPADELRGVAEHPTAGKWYQQRYGLKPASDMPPLRSGQWNQSSPWRWERNVDSEEFEKIWKERQFLWWDQFPALNARTLPGGV
ncbi:MAG: hypothetical protein LAO78_11195 [Acidobacteriia bacterium]|nr:hypothetical protein [Terriglobia bacterium]